MADKQTFETVLIKHEKLDATGIEIPFDVEAVFGAKRVPVKAVINGAEYRGTTAHMGGKYMIGVPKEFRERAGIVAGEHIVVTLEKDTVERTVTIPDDLAAALNENGVAEAFDALSYTLRKENVRSINEAKAAETRTKRIQKTVDLLLAKK